MHIPPPLTEVQQWAGHSLGTEPAKTGDTTVQQFPTPATAGAAGSPGGKAGKVLAAGEVVPVMKL